MKITRAHQMLDFTFRLLHYGIKYYGIHNISCHVGEASYLFSKYFHKFAHISKMRLHGKHHRNLNHFNIMTASFLHEQPPVKDVLMPLSFNMEFPILVR